MTNPSKPASFSPGTSHRAGDCGSDASVRPGCRVAVAVVAGCVMVCSFLVGCEVGKSQANSGPEAEVSTARSVEEIIASYKGYGNPSEAQSVARLAQLMALPTMEKRAEDLSALIEDMKTHVMTLTDASEKWYIHGMGTDAPRIKATPGKGTHNVCGGIDNYTEARCWRPYSLALDGVTMTDAQWHDLVATARSKAGSLGIDVEGVRLDKQGQRVLTLVNRHGDDISISAHENSIVVSGHTQCLLTEEMKQTIRDTGQPDDWPFPLPGR